MKTKKYFTCLISSSKKTNTQPISKYSSHEMFLPTSKPSAFMCLIGKKLHKII